MKQIRTIINQIFLGMKFDDERVVKHFIFKTPITLNLGGSYHQSHFATVLMFREKCHKTIKIFYRSGIEELPFDSLYDQMNTIECLRLNQIMPKAKDFSGAILFNAEITNIIDHAFIGMKTRKEDMAIVKFIEFSEPRFITFSNENHQQIPSVSIRLAHKDNINFIKVMYASEKHEFIRFISLEDKKFAVEFLQKNRIMPDPQAFVDSSSLTNAVGAYAIIGGCDYEDAITQNAKEYLKK